MKRIRGLYWKVPTGLMAALVAVALGGEVRAQTVTDVNASDSDASAISTGSQAGANIDLDLGENNVEAPSPFQFVGGIQLRADTPDMATAPGQGTIILPGGQAMQVSLDQNVWNVLGIASGGSVRLSELSPEQRITFWAAYADAGLERYLLLGGDDSDENRVAYAQLAYMWLIEADMVSGETRYLFSNIIQTEGHAFQFGGESVRLDDEIRVRLAQQIIDYSLPMMLSAQSAVPEVVETSPETIDLEQLLLLEEESEEE